MKLTKLIQPVLLAGLYLSGIGCQEDEPEPVAEEEREFSEFAWIKSQDFYTNARKVALGHIRVERENNTIRELFVGGTPWNESSNGEYDSQENIENLIEAIKEYFPRTVAQQLECDISLLNFEASDLNPDGSAQSLPFQEYSLENCADGNDHTLSVAYQTEDNFYGIREMHVAVRNQKGCLDLDDGFVGTNSTPIDLVGLEFRLYVDNNTFNLEYDKPIIGTEFENEIQNYEALGHSFPELNFLLGNSVYTGGESVSICPNE